VSTAFPTAPTRYERSSSGVPPPNVRATSDLRWTRRSPRCGSIAPGIPPGVHLFGLPLARPAPGLDRLFRLAAAGNFPWRFGSLAVCGLVGLDCRHGRLGPAAVGSLRLCLSLRLCFTWPLWFQRLEQVRLVGLSVSSRIGQIDEPA